MFDREMIRWAVTTMTGIAIVGLSIYYDPELIAPFGLFEFWVIKGSLWDAATNAWPIYLWGVSATAVLRIFKQNDTLGYKPIQILTGGFLVSLDAGIREEITYRWIIFLLAILLIPIGDWLLGGFAGFNVIQWIYVEFFCPAANIVTLGYLEEYLTGGYGWPVAAAIVSVSFNFSDKHEYLGPLGQVSSWFLSMYCFWILFSHGLIAAMTIHFIYDLFIFATVAVLSGIRNVPSRKCL